MKKRNFIILIVLFLLVLTLSACGRRQTESADSLPAAWAQTDKDATQPGLSFPQSSADTSAPSDTPEGYDLATLPLPEGMVMATAQLAIRDRVYTAGIGATSAVFGYSCADHTRKTLSLPKEYEFVYAMCLDGANYSPFVWLVPNCIL